ncbi:hypothetical protein ABGT15_01385 [Flavobacterium enshiense]|uniref:hypothetical protein n=1 Tax=Flavobacterium enshiense TaxID=1341165 RepID=UPI00345C9826
MKKLILFLIPTLLFVTSVWAQNTHTEKPLNSIPFIEETVYIHSNTSTLVTGETLYYKLYCLNTVSKNFSNISKIGYIELLDKDNQSLLKQKIGFNNGSGVGDFFISGNYKTGSYKLIAYTNWTLNKTAANVTRLDLFIINPYETPPTSTITKDIPIVKKNQEATPSENDKIELITEKKQFGNREKVHLRLNAKTDDVRNGNFSVSVRKIDNLPVIQPINAVAFQNSAYGKTAENDKKSTFLPELRGEIISGSISSKSNNENVKDKTVALSLPGKNFDLKIAKTNHEGKFNFILDRDPASSDAVLQVVENNRDNYIISLDKKEANTFKSLHESPELHLDSSMKKDIEERSIASQIENNYYQLKNDSLKKQSKTYPFFHPLQIEYILDDYSRFPTLKESIVEVFFEMYYKKTGEKYSVHVRDFNSKGETFGEPMVMVDGLLIQDTDELFTLDMQHIYKVSLINKTYIYGPKTFDGLINFTTKNFAYTTNASGDFIKKVTLQRPLIEKKYFAPDYSVNPNQRIPDFRYQLAWIPEINFQNQESSIDFFTSDVKGNFEISLEGFTKKGEPISIKSTFSVE